MKFFGRTTEEFAAHNYIRREARQSVIDPSVTHSIEVAIICPRCKTELPLLDHGKHQTCHKCGLYMELYGNCLRCST